MPVFHFEVAGRRLTFDSDAPLMVGDVYALRDAAAATGIDPEAFTAALNSDDADAKGQAVVAIAYLAAVRKNHALTWREFIWSTPVDGIRMVDDAAPPQVRVPVVDPITAPVDEAEMAARITAQLAGRIAE